MKIALAQINPTIGAIADNSAKIKDAIKRAGAAGADLVVFPELAVTGYPPKDLLLKPRFIDENIAAVAEIAEWERGVGGKRGDLGGGRIFIKKKEGCVCHGE